MVSCFGSLGFSRWILSYILSNTCNANLPANAMVKYKESDRCAHLMGAVLVAVAMVVKNEKCGPKRGKTRIGRFRSNTRVVDRPPVAGGE